MGWRLIDNHDDDDGSFIWNDQYYNTIASKCHKSLLCLIQHKRCAFKVETKHIVNIAVISTIGFFLRFRWVGTTGPDVKNCMFVSAA